LKGTEYVLTCWGDTLYSRLYYDESGVGAFDNETYGTPPDPADFTNEPRYYSIYCSYTSDNTSPDLWNISTNLTQVDPTYGLIIQANISDNISGVNIVKVNITYPNSTVGSFTMNHTSGYTYQYCFNDTQQCGQYNYVIWAVDNAGNSNTSNTYSFNVTYLFGYTTAGSTGQNINNRISGSIFTINDNGTADNITAYIKVKGFIAPAPRYKCMIYRLNDSTLIGTTEEKIPSGSGLLGVIPNERWVTFNFTGTKPTLTKNTTYILTCLGNSTKAYLYYNTCANQYGRYNQSTYGTPPNPAVFTNETKLYSIYCRYTPDT